MKTQLIILLIASLNFSPMKAQDITDTMQVFVQSLREDILNKKYKWVDKKQEIPKSVFSFINKWKKRNEKYKSRFALANPDEDYNCCCFQNPKLLNRRLIWAGKKDNEWVIIYEHGEGRVSNIKLLHINMSKRNDISFLYMHQIYSESPITTNDREQILFNCMTEEYLRLFKGDSVEDDFIPNF